MKKEIFIEKANKIHDNYYDYSLVENNVNTQCNINIICPEHGKFEQRGTHHLSGHKCLKCSYKNRNSKGLDYFIEKSKKVHGDKYDYSLITEENYINSDQLVPIICHEKNKNGQEHRIFLQRLYDHSSGHRCPICKSKKLSELYTKPLNQLIIDFKKVHGDKIEEILERELNICQN